MTKMEYERVPVCIQGFKVAIYLFIDFDVCMPHGFIVSQVRVQKNLSSNRAINQP